MEMKGECARLRRVCFVVSAPETEEAFLRPHILELSDENAISVVANFPTGVARPSGSNVQYIHVAIQRTARPAADAIAVLRLLSVFRRERFDVVHSVTPKAGLLAMLAAAMMGVPHRIHWFTGQVWATKTGGVRRVLRSLDRLTAMLATRVLVDSPSQLEFLVREGVLNSDKATVLGSGSICGVDTSRFRPDPDARRIVRSRLGISQEAIVLLYVGRINSDKGILDLATAIQTLALHRPEGMSPLVLTMAGTDEEGIIPTVTKTLAAQGTQCIYLGHTTQPERLMAAADIYCMPSHREGFGLSVIEAASCEVPSVASAVYGLTDAVVDGGTGLLFSSSDTAEMAECIRRLACDADFRHHLGKQARERVKNKFDQGQLIAALKEEYQTMKKARHRG